MLESIEYRDVTVLPQDGQTVLHLAASAGHLATVEALLDRGCDANVQDFVSTTQNLGDSSLVDSVSTPQILEAVCNEVTIFADGPHGATAGLQWRPPGHSEAAAGPGRQSGPPGEL